MKCELFVPLVWMMIACLPALSQQKVYPVRASNNIPVILTADRSAFVVERGFQHKLTLGFPDDDRVSFIPDTGAAVVMLWLRIQNVSQRSFDLDVVQFAGTDETGKM